ncbi:ketoacyl-synthetase C-terminal extension domain-containing protein, partial [Saccharothrix sp. ST-888]|uniref:ketoacyl-synthetase C-terminal extension domain-containing protein n=1 Tax=Saccharothrix sp. ST-888 TaxID=1427391 RepID=UPI0005EC393A
TGEPRRAGVSAFGVSGTNAHTILEQAPAVEAEAVEASVSPSVVPVVLSAKGETALRAQARELQSRVEADPELTVTDLGY